MRQRPMIYKRAFAPLWTWQAVLLAGGATLAIFLILPFSELISRQSHSPFTFRPVDTATIRPPPRRPPPPRYRRREKSAVPRPKLSRVQSLLRPLQIGSSIELGEIAGGFPLDFAFRIEAAPDLHDLVFELSEVDQPPQPVVQLPPIYPVSARARGIEGKVDLAFVVWTDGSVGEIKVESSLPGTVFDQAALNAVKRWKFKPALRNGLPVASRVRLPLTFRLKN